MKIPEAAFPQFFPQEKRRSLASARNRRMGANQLPSYFYALLSAN